MVKYDARVDLSFCVINDKWACDYDYNDEQSDTESLHCSIYINAGSNHHLSLSLSLSISSYVSSSSSYSLQCQCMHLLSLASPSSTFPL